MLLSIRKFHENHCCESSTLLKIINEIFFPQFPSFLFQFESKIDTRNVRTDLSSGCELCKNWKPCFPRLLSSWRESQCKRATCYTIEHLWVSVLYSAVEGGHTFLWVLMKLHLRALCDTIWHFDSNEHHLVYCHGIHHLQSCLVVDAVLQNLNSKAGTHL
jgi:hypothetical protein